jgi:hypothetical protein
MHGPSLTKRSIRTSSPRTNHIKKIKRTREPTLLRPRSVWPRMAWNTAHSVWNYVVGIKTGPSLNGCSDRINPEWNQGFLGLCTPLPLGLEPCLWTREIKPGQDLVKQPGSTLSRCGMVPKLEPILGCRTTPKERDVFTGWEPATIPYFQPILDIQD